MKMTKFSKNTNTSMSKTHSKVFRLISKISAKDISQTNFKSNNKKWIWVNYQKSLKKYPNICKSKTNMGYMSKL